MDCCMLPTTMYFIGSAERTKIRTLAVATPSYFSKMKYWILGQELQLSFAKRPENDMKEEEEKNLVGVGLFSL